jgi:hypothetical protein
VVVIRVGVGFCQVAMFLEHPVSLSPSGIYQGRRRLGTRVTTDESIVPARPRRRVLAPVLPQLIKRIQRCVDRIMHFFAVNRTQSRAHAVNALIEPPPLRRQWVCLSHEATIRCPDRHSGVFESAPTRPSRGRPPRTFLVQDSHSARAAQRPRVRALRAAFPSRSPLLPALTRSLRAASAFLTSPPHRAKRARSGTLRLYSASKQAAGGTNPETHWGKTRNPPGHPKPPGFQVFPQTPFPASPARQNPPRK